MTEEDMAKKKKQMHDCGGRGGGRGRRGKGGKRGEERNFKRKRPWEKGPRKSEDNKDSESKGDHVRFDDAKGEGGNKDKAETKDSGNDQPAEAKKVKTDES